MVSGTKTIREVAKAGVDVRDFIWVCRRAFRL